MDRDMTVMARADKILASRADWLHVDAHSNRLGGIELAKLAPSRVILAGCLLITRRAGVAYAVCAYVVWPNATFPLSPYSPPRR